MTYTKAASFTEQQQEIARFAKVLSHPARVAILQHLAEVKTCISGDISGTLPLSRTTVSQHLQELKSAGLVKGEINGQTVCYCIDQLQFEKAMNLFQEVLIGIRGSCIDDDCC